MARLVSQRLPDKMRTDRDSLDELLDSTVLAHVGVMVEGRAMVFPTGFARVGDELVIHGSTGSGWLRALSDQEVSVTVTRVDAVVVARSTFESSMHYRSAMIMGRFTAATGERKNQLLDAYSERVVPGRNREVRSPTRREYAATLALVLPIEQWSLRVSNGWPEDAPDDLEGDAWAGVVRFDPVTASVEAAPDLRVGIPVPPSVRELAAHPDRLA